MERALESGRRILSGGEIDFVVNLGEREDAINRSKLDTLLKAVNVHQVPVVLRFTSPVFDMRFILRNHQVFEERRERAVMLEFPGSIIVLGRFREHLDK